MRGRPLGLLIAEGLSILVLLAVLVTLGVSLGSAVNDGLRSSFAKKPVDAAPAWSPDGSLIAFVRTVHDKTTLYVMDADGAEQIGLVSAAPDTGVSWLGRTRIAFLRSDGAFSSTVDGAFVQRLAGQPPGIANPASRALSPNGRHLAFVRDGHIFVGGRNGEQAVQLTGT
jgi:Tol biopolymer transport system component